MTQQLREAVKQTGARIVGLSVFLTLAFDPMKDTVMVAHVVLSMGQVAIAPLCFSVIGDLFEPAARAKWSGMLNLPAGIAATIAPTLSGMITESNMGWRGLFWVVAPVVVISGILVAMAIPGQKQKV